MTKKLPYHVDFPAAHSMDATWFAVDRDGHVGVFDSGEPGATPTEVDEVIGQSDDAVEMALESLPVTGEPTFKLSAVFHPGLRSGVMPRRREPHAGVATLIFRDKGALTTKVRALPSLHVSTEGTFVLVSLRPDAGSTRCDPQWSPMSRDVDLTKREPQWRVWYEFKSVAAAAPSYVTAFNVFWPELSFARRGLFAYSTRTNRFHIAEPYCQVFAPQAPLRLDQVVAPVRDLLAARARLDVSFASSPYVQPVELVPCAAWAKDVYLASDGFTVRPFPGTAGYHGSAAELLYPWPDDKKLYKPVVFDPPLDPDSQ